MIQAYTDSAGVELYQQLEPWEIETTPEDDPELLHPITEYTVRPGPIPTDARTLTLQLHNGPAWLEIDLDPSSQGEPKRLWIAAYNGRLILCSEFEQVTRGTGAELVRYADPKPTQKEEQ